MYVCIISIPEYSNKQMYVCIILQKQNYIVETADSFINILQLNVLIGL